MESISLHAGENAKKINVLELVPLLEAAGAAAVAVHGVHRSSDRSNPDMLGVIFLFPIEQSRRACRTLLLPERNNRASNPTNTMT